MNITTRNVAAAATRGALGAQPSLAHPGVYSNDLCFFCDAREMDMGCIEDYYDGEQSEYGLESLDDGADEQLLCSGKSCDCNRTT